MKKIGLCIALAIILLGITACGKKEEKKTENKEVIVVCTKEEGTKLEEDQLIFQNDKLVRYASYQAETVEEAIIDEKYKELVDRLDLLQKENPKAGIEATQNGTQVGTRITISVSDMDEKFQSKLIFSSKDAKDSITKKYVEKGYQCK